MSSGFFGFFAHCGVISALEEAGLRPRRVTGSSAGGLVGAAWAAGLTAAQLEEALLHLERQEFWDPRPGPGLLRGKRFMAKLYELFPVHRFGDCKFPVALSVFEPLFAQTRVLEKGDLIRATVATCAVPGLFWPVRIKGRFYFDGGVLDRPGHAPLRDGERVLYHHLASRSPWRRQNSPALAMPNRQEMTTLVISDLPRSGPFRLDRGRLALQRAKQETKRALDLEIQDRMVRLSSS